MDRAAAPPRRQRPALSFAALVIRLVVRALVQTWRLDIRGDRSALERLCRGDEPFVLSFWHDRSPLAAGLLLRHILGRIPVTLLASQSRDGELVARIARPWGVSIVRGSASRGGREAIRQIYRQLVHERSSPILIPDGPRGPQYHYKVGVVVLAQMSGAAILPLGFASTRAWRLRSWDRMLVPKPFARVMVWVGAPQSVPRDVELEMERQRLESHLTEVTARAEEELTAPRS
jgi:lysophospholipid acyltransferase (LPLAT)-like uncharacterized protein